MTERTCTIEGCDKKHYGRGWCYMHWQRVRRYGRTSLPDRPPKRVRLCPVSECDRPVHAKGYCKRHYIRWARHGDPTYRIRGEVRNGCRICPRCRKDLPLSAYGSGGPGRAARYCKPCTYAKAKAWAERNPDRAREVAASWARRNPEVYRRKSSERRALLRGSRSDEIDRLEVFDRDEWICGLCGGAIDRSATWPAAGFASIDHIVPLALGGAHVFENVQAAHLGCNLRKGHRLVTEKGEL